MRYKRLYSEWKEDPQKVSFTLVLTTPEGVTLGSRPIDLTKPYSSTQLLVAIRAAVRSIEAGPDGTGLELLERALKMENET